MFGRLLVLFLIVPVVEVTLLITAGERLGFGATFGLVVASALLGSWLARREGVAAWRRVQERMARGEMPGTELVDGLIVLVAATLLVTPGFLTDVAGLLGLFPPTRAVARRALARSLERRVAAGAVQVATFRPGASFGGPTVLPGVAPPAEDAEVIDDGR